MSTDCVSVRLPCKQPLLTYAVGALGLALFCLCYGLSAWSTIRFTQQLGDHGGGVPAAPFGVAWEGARLFFTLLGLLAGARRWGGPLVFRLAMIAVLNLGSTAASVANLWQQDTADQLATEAQALHLERRRRAQEQVADVLKGATDAVGVLVAAGRGSKALDATSAIIKPLLDQATALGVATVEEGTTPDRAVVTGAFFANVASHLWDGDKDANGINLRSRIGLLLAVMADLIILGVPFTWMGATRRPHSRAGAGEQNGGAPTADATSHAPQVRKPRLVVTPAPASSARWGYAPEAACTRSAFSAPDRAPAPDAPAPEEHALDHNAPRAHGFRPAPEERAPDHDAPRVHEPRSAPEGHAPGHGAPQVHELRPVNEGRAPNHGAPQVREHRLAPGGLAPNHGVPGVHELRPAPEGCAPEVHAPNHNAPQVHQPRPSPEGRAPQVRAPGHAPTLKATGVQLDIQGGRPFTSGTQAQTALRPRHRLTSTRGTPGTAAGVLDMEHLHVEARGLRAKGLLSLNQRDVKAKLGVGQAKAEQILKRLRAEEDSEPQAVFSLFTAVA